MSLKSDVHTIKYIVAVLAFSSVSTCSEIEKNNDLLEENNKNQEALVEQNKEIITLLKEQKKVINFKEAFDNFSQNKNQVDHQLPPVCSQPMKIN